MNRFHRQLNNPTLLGIRRTSLESELEQKKKVCIIPKIPITALSFSEVYRSHIGDRTPKADGIRHGPNVEKNFQKNDFNKEGKS